jgi:hypothetical protein
VVEVLLLAEVEPQEHRERAQAVLVELAIFMQAVQVHQEQEHLSAVAAVEQGFHLLAQMLLQTTAVTVEMAAVVVEQPPH